MTTFNADTSNITVSFVMEYAGQGPEDGGEGPISLRILRRDQHVGWKRIPVATALAVYEGKVNLPELANQTVDIAFAYVKLFNRKPFRLSRVERTEWQFDGMGKINEHAVFQQILDKINGVPSEQSRTADASTFSIEDVNAIRRVLGVN